MRDFSNFVIEAKITGLSTFLNLLRSFLITKLEKSLKWKPSYNIKDTLKITWDDDETLPSLEN